ncbi:Ig-like domain-containing protein [Embleya sp. NBC_00896]|uniref:L,D-transpeptidase n=1 Tax=Embleya sp. NBC_00896 TaxID=2975961 RepID=UPI0038659CA9|nr:Ig-like domain-containing protein [Embleya sp. NBC_00896]
MSRESAVRLRWIGWAVTPVVPLVFVAGCGTWEKQRAAEIERPATGIARVDLGVRTDRPTPAGEPITVQARDGRLYAVSLIGPDGRLVPGANATGGGSWSSSEPLDYDTEYTLTASAVDAFGLSATRRTSFRTISPDAEMRADTVLPEAGSTVGVGMPITVGFDRPINDPRLRAAVEKRLIVSASTPVEGAWGWVDDDTVRYRPKNYWPVGTKVSVTTSLIGLDFGGGVYGGPGEPVVFDVGDAVVATVDAGAHSMTVSRNGTELRTLAVTTGKPGFTTRSGTKVVLGKQPHVVMDGTTVGIAAGSSDSYRLDVYWATRVTWSGEFVHAAPWSVGAQGRANVSHGCVGMSTENAKWFYDQVKVGDIVTVVNTGNPKTMEPVGNGYGEWNLDWAEWLSMSTTGPATVRPL